ncbi:MAG: bifunctional lysine ketoglutarate reductase /saccharopine dehydrogenase family protein [Pseudomonadota bacterium]
MATTIGIRKEDKNRWERRAPLSPADVGRLRARGGMEFVVQSSPTRVFSDSEYRAAGATVTADLGAADIILAVKEIPAGVLIPGKTYAFFSHVIKGQRQNMPMLARILELGCSLLDYERIVDERERRLLFFGRHAGNAGAIDTLWCLGQRLLALGIPTALADLRIAHEYDSLAEAKKHLSAVGQRLRSEGLPAEISPLVVGIAGYGNVSKGAQEVLAALPATVIPVADLAKVCAGHGSPGEPIVSVVFTERDMVRPASPGTPFVLEEYYRQPEKYVSRFEEVLPFLDVLLNTIYWTERYPRFVTRDWARRAWTAASRPRLKVVGDISCDIDGSIELTVKTTTPDAPAYVIDPVSGSIGDGIEGNGLAIMAIDNLPCQLPREASEHFGSVLREMVSDLAAADWRAGFDELGLPPHLEKAVIAHHGALTPSYQYLEAFLRTATS